MLDIGEVTGCNSLRVLGHPCQPFGPCRRTVRIALINAEQRFIVEENIAKEHPLIGAE